MPSKKKETRGAPRKPEAEKMNNFIMIGFTKKESADVKRAAKKLDMSRSRFVAEASANQHEVRDGGRWTARFSAPFLYLLFIGDVFNGREYRGRIY